MIAQAILSSQPKVIREVPVPPTAQLVVAAATAQAVIATTQAGIATTKANAAAASEATATAQAAIATAQAGISTTKAIEAAASAASFRVNSATYAAIPTLTASCFVFVSADETNGNQPTVYFFDGTNLNWLPSVGV